MSIVSKFNVGKELQFSITFYKLFSSVIKSLELFNRKKEIDICDKLHSLNNDNESAKKILATINTDEDDRLKKQLK